MPRCNTAAMPPRLSETSGAVVTDAVVLLDQAGWYTAKAVQIPGNITLMPLSRPAPQN